ncbi:hypothetical protein TRFO_05704 [Tritrichomonas foetus]|uniref:Uncharacterized protein n=1 Tax=Tritrichomonas foetus TaxID=1144522 RepID=A0A1J4K8Q3_9EUKA|nr:hypothetical protein TRFO_05704 [Tritrichomonas foetus]|eukprot:OHT06054.1 hypothetical protein TRFO_05704 [Tritrichomonas foetus]
MYQQTLLSMKQQQITENFKKAAEAYFQVPDKPENSTCRPHPSQRIDFDFHFTNTDSPDPDPTCYKIQKMSNTDFASPCFTGESLVNELKYVGKISDTIDDPEQINKFAKTFKLLHPNIILPSINAICMRDDNSLLASLETTPIDIKEIEPFFALSDEIRHIDSQVRDTPLLKMVAKHSKDPFIQAPSFISNLKRDVVKQLDPQVRERYNFLQQVRQFLPEELPKLELEDSLQRKALD